MTDARIEAAAKAIAEYVYERNGKPMKWENMGDNRQEVARCYARVALEAADAAAWNTDIKKAPGFRQTIVVHLKNGDTTLANNEFPQGEDGWVDMTDENIAEADIEAWMLIPRFAAPTKEATP
ncbi:hypothetical protein BJI49_09760 [Acetobacter pasteurianus]|uniref:hypothetical protein n=1 Tax=Acetobacter pasteurianus TaxID=438 RepID=UPI0002457D69|nr:hypothetical protein [Acetobacter pasteurianus]RCL05807.1 hypothetical protein BJI49_09760 [Acetobacter pasteurianus]GAB31848.1 hypothetical protein APS_2450 [Acetobacter pasteurianus subsp. pasteurianus LMG 1262 = NBRC 106471]GCD50137.1 hypothetical protein NBRC106471_1693 [Acetobacter pasteurianus subsp. pasteurianus LMG 1262 = NBRC 106471]